MIAKKSVTERRPASGANISRVADIESISIVVPVVNEAALIGPFLQHLRARAPGAEIIVVDGGSSDQTDEIATRFCDQLVTAPRSRALQLNAGAGAAGGAILWFLHVDSVVPFGALNQIHQVLSDPQTVGGFFRIRLPDEHAIYRLTDCFAHYAGILLRIRCGDHGFFCRRTAFTWSGGFPDVPLMEDVEFFRALHRFGRVRAIVNRLSISPRRYEQFGRWRVTFSYGLIATLYALGFPLARLNRLYLLTCCGRQERRKDSAGAGERPCVIKASARRPRSA